MGLKKAIANRPTIFTIEVTDESLKPFSVSQSDILLQIQYVGASQEKVSTKITETKTGVYSVEYIAKRTGYLTLDVGLAGKSILKAPLRVLVSN